MDTKKIRLWHKVSHSYCAPSNKLYDPYWIKTAIVFNVPKEWLENKSHDYGYDSADILLNNYTPEESASIHDEAIKDKVLSKDYLYYMFNKTQDDCKESDMCCLLKDLHTVKQLTTNVSGTISEAKTLDAHKEKHKQEFNDLVAIGDIIQKELSKRLANISKEKQSVWNDIDYNMRTPYVDFINIDISKLNRTHISDLCGMAANLYNFFDNVKAPKKKSAQHEYDYCVILLDAILCELHKRLKYLSR